MGTEPGGPYVVTTGNIVVFRPGPAVYKFPLAAALHGQASPLHGGPGTLWPPSLQVAELGSAPSADSESECTYTTVDVVAAELIQVQVLFVHAYVGPVTPPGSVFVDGLRSEFKSPVSAARVRVSHGLEYGKLTNRRTGEQSGLYY